MTGRSLSHITRYLLVVATVFLLHANALAHEIRPAYLKITETSENNYNVFWKVPMTQGKYINILPKFDSQSSLTETHKTSTAEAIIREYNIGLENTIRGRSIEIENLEKTLIDVLVQIDMADETTYSFMVQPSSPQFSVPFEFSFWQVVRTYFHLGVEHIWLGYDHLLFVLGLFLLIQGVKPLIKTITSFTLAHSITLALASLGMINVSSSPVEAVIALSIVLLALEAYNFQKGKTSLTIQYPWIVAFMFGLIHGLGFAGALSEIGLPQKSIPSALLFFNLGVEFGQIVFVFFLWLLFYFAKKYFLSLHLLLRKITPYLIGSLGMYWLIDRLASF